VALISFKKDSMIFMNLCFSQTLGIKFLHVEHPPLQELFIKQCTVRGLFSYLEDLTDGREMICIK